MTQAAEILVSVLILIGSVFTLVGSFGLIKLKNVMTGLHAPTKSTTLGVGSMLIASMIYFGVVNGSWTIHELVVTVFLFATAPVTASFISKVYLHDVREARGHIPLPEADGRDWSTYRGKDEGALD